ncbi:hypothetical protein NL676_013057 [Syzygium grande]|nr:hypothetical protein NL676_013057 [Syzygium grande]
MASGRVCLFIGLLCFISLYLETSVAREVPEPPIEHKNIGPCSQFVDGCYKTCVGRGHPIHERGPLPPTSGVRLLAPTPTPPPASDGLASASALASDTSDERGSPLPTSDVRRLPRARSTISDKRGLSPRADADAASDERRPSLRLRPSPRRPCRRRLRRSPTPTACLCEGKTQSGPCAGTSFRASGIRALFWRSKKSLEPRETVDLSLGDYTLTAPGAEDVSTTKLRPMQKHNPFLSHGFLSSLEESHSAMKETGWMPRHIVAKDESGTVIGVVPLYLKSHSYGEFVFDHSWADAYYSYGSTYYPKYQCCVPFTPVTGPRILLRDSSYKDQVFDIVVDALKNLVAKVSSIHITFSSENEWHYLKEKGFLRRIGMQYHWRNRNYTCFDDFLIDMKQNKRKNIYVRSARRFLPKT